MFLSDLDSCKSSNLMLFFSNQAKEYTGCQRNVVMAMTKFDLRFVWKLGSIPTQMSEEIL